MPNELPDRWQHYSVLVVDDEEGMRSFLARALQGRCRLVETAESAEDADTLLSRTHFDLILLDISLPGKSGVEWLAQLRENGYSNDVILMTAFADMDTAINAVRLGAADFVLKPFRLDQMLNAIRRCFDRATLARENFLLKRQIESKGIEGLVGQSTVVRQLVDVIRRVAPMPSTVLITGESGTGKEVTARALHELSLRASQPFVPVNCGAIAPELIESELFGHVKGAYTGASDARNGLFYYANGGTLFLDEISELPLNMQTKLLRVLEERRIRPVGSEKELAIDVRIIAASNRDLAAEVTAKRFRQDLYFRLDVINIHIAPLRDRLEDIPLLVGYFSRQLSAQLGLPPLPVSEAELARMMAYDWPGNARELRNLVERALILGYYPVDQLPCVIQDAGASPALPAGDPALLLDEVERRHILQVLSMTSGNKSEAARKLGISRKTLERKCALWQQST